MNFYKQTVNLIVCFDDNYGISKNNSIPWDIKEDTNFFQDATKKVYECFNSYGVTYKEENKKNAVIMGRNTWDNINSHSKISSIPTHPSKRIGIPQGFPGLKDRVNIIISNTLSTEYIKSLSLNEKIKNDYHVCNSLEFALELCNTLDIGQVFICGGSRIYKESLDLVNNSKYDGKYKIDNIYTTHIFWDYLCDNFFPYDVLFLEKYKETKKHEFDCFDYSIKMPVKVCFTKYSYKNTIESNSKYNNVENKEEEQYLNLLKNIIIKGSYRQTRNSYTWSIFGQNLEFDLSKHFPILTTKRLFFRGVFEELLFFLRGDTDSNHLLEKGVKIWKGNTNREFLDKCGLKEYQEGDMGPMYGFQWRYHNAEYVGCDKNYFGKGFDQFEYCLNLLKTDPFSRRILMTTYNPSYAKEGVLFPCHGISIIFYVDIMNYQNNKNINQKYSLSCMMTQRSVDTFLGCGFNISSYALLVYLICEIINNDENYTGLKYIPGKLIMNLADTHIYKDHYTQCIRQILRDPYEFPKLKFKRKVNRIEDFMYEDIELCNYKSYTTIKADMIV